VKPGADLESRNEKGRNWRLLDALARVSPGHTDLAIRRKARLLAICLLAMSGIFVCADAAFLLTIPNYTPPWPGYLFLLGTYWLNRRGKYAVAAPLSLAMFPVVVFGQLFVGTSANALTVLGFLTLSPLLGAILLSARGVGVLTLVNMCGIALMPLVVSQELSPGESVGSLAAMAISGALAIVYMRHRDQLELDRLRHRQSLEERLRQAQKLEAIGRLAGGIAHDFNNLLTVILGNIALAKLENPGRALTDAEKACDSAAALTKQLLAFSRQAVLKSTVLNLNDVLRTTASMLARIIGEDISLQVIEGAALANSRADATQVQEILLNLATNARDAMPAGGKLTFSTGNRSIAEGEADGRIAPGEYACLEVTDTGVGMDEETLALAFEPFFTTKPVGQGTGLGLAMVFGIIHQSGGFIRVESRLGVGTVFRLYFPKVDASVDHVQHTVPAARGGAETILLVEDEPALRQLCEKVLKRAGYHVVSAASAEAARTAWQSAARPFDLLLTDIVMPGESGSALATALKREASDLVVILMSGYAPESHHAVPDPSSPLELIEKPFAPDALLQCVRRTLDARRR